MHLNELLKTLFRTFFILALLILSIGKAQAQNEGYESITSSNLLKTVDVLCSKDFNGRLPGSEGYNKAADYAAEKFSEAGLTPYINSSYFQYLKVEYNQIDSPVVFKVILEEKETKYELGKDFVFRGFSGSADVRLPVVFCGYGLSRPDLGYDDYDGVDVKDKIVIVFKQNPIWKINDSTWRNEYPREKSTVAYKHGAKGILFVSRPNDNKPQPLIGSVMHGDGEQLVDFPQLQISIDVANIILSETGKQLSECQATIDHTQKPYSLLTESKAEIFVKANYIENAQTMNVVGLLEGSDPVLKNEYLIIGAHLDHVGSQAGLLFPGANDNASGTAAVIQLAQAFAKNADKPKRSIIFVLFASEEQGLFGSKYFAEHLNIDTEKVVAMFNIDCIGYGESIQVGNGKSAPDLWNIANKLDEENFNLMVEDTWSGGGADLTPFYDKGMPGLYFVSKYSYDHLHQPTDTPETINPVLYENIVKLVFLTASEVLSGNYKREKTVK